MFDRQQAAGHLDLECEHTSQLMCPSFSCRHDNDISGINAPETRKKQGVIASMKGKLFNDGSLDSRQQKKGSDVVVYLYMAAPRERWKLRGDDCYNMRIPVASCLDVDSRERKRMSMPRPVTGTDVSILSPGNRPYGSAS